MNIDIDEDFPEHPKTLRFCGLIGNPLGWSYIWKLWRFCAKYRPDGDLTRLDPADIEAGVGWSALDGRFFAAAVKAGFIDRDERGARVHDWMQHMGAGLIRMEVDRLRKASSRAAKGGDKEEAGRLDGVIAALRKRLSTVGSRTSDGRPTDFHGTAADVQRTSDGQVPNGGGLPSNGDGHPPDVHRMSGVSALLCSALLCSDLSPCAGAGDPTEPEPVAPALPPAPRPAEGATIHPLPSPPGNGITPYDLLEAFGKRWRDRWDLPWAPDRNAAAAARDLLEEQIGRMAAEDRTEAIADLLPALDRYLADKTPSLEKNRHPFPWFVDRFNQYRVGAPGTPAAAKAQQQPPWFDPNNQPR